MNGYRREVNEDSGMELLLRQIMIYSELHADKCKANSKP